MQAFRDSNRTITVKLDAFLDARHKPHFVERHLGQQQDVRWFALRLAGQATGGGDPAGVAAHHLKDKILVEVSAIEATS